MYVIEKKVRDDWAADAPSDFSSDLLEWHVVDYNGDPSRMGYLEKDDAVVDMPRNLDDWFECRVRNIQTGEVVASYAGHPIPYDYIGGDRLERPINAPETLTIEQLAGLRARYYESSKFVRSMCSTIARELGQRQSATYGPKYVYSPDDPDSDAFYNSRRGLVIYVDDYGNYMDIYLDGKRVCISHTAERFFAPGEWVKRIRAIYPEAYEQVKRRRQEKEAQERQRLLEKFQ